MLALSAVALAGTWFDDITRMPAIAATAKAPARLPEWAGAHLLLRGSTLFPHIFTNSENIRIRRAATEVTTEQEIPEAYGDNAPA